MSAVAPNPATDAPTTDARVEELVESFSFLDDWDDRFRYPIDLGRRLAPMEPALKTEETKVRGCTSQVWIVERVAPGRSEEHTSELQSLMRISYAVFCLKKKKIKKDTKTDFKKSNINNNVTEKRESNQEERNEKADANGDS